MDLASLQAERQRMLAKLRDTVAQADERISAGRHKIALSEASFLKPADGPHALLRESSSKTTPQAEAAASVSASVPARFSTATFLKPRSEPEPEPEPSSPWPMNGSFPKVRAPGSPTALESARTLEDRDVKRELWDASEAQPHPQPQPHLAPQSPFLQGIVGIDGTRGAAVEPGPTTSWRDTEREFALLARREKAWQAERQAAAERESQLIADMAAQRAAVAEAAMRPASATTATTMSPIPSTRHAIASVQTSPKLLVEASRLEQALNEVDALRRQVLDLERDLAEERELADAGQQVLVETEKDNEWLTTELRKLESDHHAALSAAQGVAAGWERKLVAHSEQHGLDMARKEARIAQLTEDLATARAAVVASSMDHHAPPTPLASAGSRVFSPGERPPGSWPDPVAEGSDCQHASGARNLAVEALEAELAAVKQVAVQQTMQAHAAKSEVKELQEMLAETTKTALHHAKVMEAESSREIANLRKQLAERNSHADTQ